MEDVTVGVSTDWRNDDAAVRMDTRMQKNKGGCFLRLRQQTLIL